jgi:hypothetical protein
VIPQVSEQPVRDWLVVQSGPEALEIRQRLGIALPGLLGVAPDRAKTVMDVPLVWLWPYQRDIHNRRPPARVTFL